METIKGHVRTLWQRLGPYVLIEILLPGGSALAILLFLYRRYVISASPPGYDGAAR